MSHEHHQQHSNVDNHVSHLTPAAGIHVLPERVVAPENVSTREPMPPRYKTDMMADGAEMVPTIAGMVEALRTDWSANGMTAELIKNTYAVAREIGDREIRARDPLGAATRLLDQTRADARPTQYTFDADHASLGSFEHTKGQLIIGSGIYGQAELVQKKMEDEGITPKNKDDALVIAFMYTAAHEAGHAVAKGISDRVAAKSGDSEAGAALYGESLYLHEHPEQALTGSVTTDVYAHAERFAEGYGKLVVRTAMRALGYSRREIGKISSNDPVQQLRIQGEHGHNQLDFIGKNAGVAALTELVEAPKEIPHKNNDGNLGYAKPLSPTAIVRNLRVMAEAIDAGKSGAAVQMRKDPEAWWRRVQASRPALDVRLYLNKMHARRKDELDPKGAARRFIGRRVAAAALMSLSILGAEGYGEEIADSPRIVERSDVPGYHTLEVWSTKRYKDSQRAEKERATQSRGTDAATPKASKRRAAQNSNARDDG